MPDLLPATRFALRLWEWFRAIRLEAEGYPDTGYTADPRQITLSLEQQQ